MKTPAQFLHAIGVSLDPGQCTIVNRALAFVPQPDETVVVSLQPLDLATVTNQAQDGDGRFRDPQGITASNMEQRVLELNGLGLSNTDIALRVGRIKSNEVSQILVKFGRAAKRRKNAGKITLANLGEIRALIVDGRTDLEISVSTGWAESTIRSIRNGNHYLSRELQKA